MAQLRLPKAYPIDWLIGQDGWLRATDADRTRPVLMADHDKLTVEVRSQTLHGRRTAYRIAGEEPGILLVHGITNDSASWEPILELLAGAGEQAIAPDLPGHGASDRM